MKTSAQPSRKPLKGIAALYDDFERKELFRKYVFFLAWVEVLILAVCWLNQLGDGATERMGVVEASFPWKTYFLVSFLTPVAITFILGVIIVGFNKYFSDAEPAEEATSSLFDAEDIVEDKSSRIYKLSRLVGWMQKLPFLALLLLLCIGAVLFYKLDVFIAFMANVGEKSVHFLIISGAVLLGIASIFAVLLIVMNYKLRKKSMDYQYKSDVADRFGLIILDDNTVLNKDGKMLVQGKNWQGTVPLIPEIASESEEKEVLPATIRRPVDVEG